MMEWPLKAQTSNPLKLEMKLDKSFIHSKENLWPELQKDEGTLMWEFSGHSLALPQIDAKGGHSKSTT